MTQDFRIALIKAGLSQVQLAANIGVHPSTVSRIVNGWLEPPADVKRAIRQELGSCGRRLRFGWRVKGGQKN